MERTLLHLLLAVGLALRWPEGVAAQSIDPELVKGIRQVEEGDYDVAIFTLDSAARRLAAEKPESDDLPQAYLYLGIAYLGKGHEAAARAKFREAVSQIKDLTLSPDRFPPRVIDLVEAAREEADKAASALVPAHPATPGKKKGSKAVLILLGVGAAAAAGVGVAASGGGEAGEPERRMDSFAGTVGTTAPGGEYALHQIAVGKAGTLDAHLTWMDRGVPLTMRLLEDASSSSRSVAESTPGTGAEARLVTQVSSRTYYLEVRAPSSSPDTPYTVQVLVP